MTGAIVVLEGSGPSAATLLEPRCNITDSGTTRIVKINNKVALKPGSHSQRSRDSGQCLAQITVDEWRISFEANVEGFLITPPGVESLPKFTNIKLPASTKGHRQSTILRPGDSIHFSDTETPFHLTLRIEDDVEVGSSIPDQAEDDEVPETQEQPSRRAYSTEKANHRARRGIQVEESIQGLPSQLRSATPAQTIQSEIVEETPTTHRKIARVPQPAQTQDTVNTREVASTIVSTPTSSIVERPKGRRNANPQRVSNALELGSIGAKEAQDQDDVTTASESEHDEKTMDPSYSTTPENVGTGRGSERRAIPSTDEGGDEEMALDEVNETPKRFAHPEVRIPLSRGSKKRTSVERDTPQEERSNKKRRKATRTLSPASSIRVRADKTPAGTARRQLEPESEEDNSASSENSQQSSAKSSPSQAYSGKPPRIAFSNTNVIERDTPMRFLKKQGVRTVDKVTSTGCDVICIGTAAGTLVKSAKLLLGLALGKSIVSDTWVTKSLQAQSLLDPAQFPPLNAPKEWEWGDSVASVKSVLEIDRSELFQDRILFITPALKKEYGGGYGDIEKVAKAVGAKKLISKPARDYTHSEDTIILASEQGDLEAMTLSGAEKGYQCYTKDLLTSSILRGVLDLENDEFKLKPSGSQQKKARGTAGRKKRG